MDKGGKGMWVMVPFSDAPKGKGGKFGGKGGKGGGQQGGGSKKRKKENAGPVQSIDGDMVEKITDLLNENGGELSLGRVTTVFPGLKKVQVEEHFNVQEVGDGDFLVTTGGIGAGPLVSGEKRVKVKKEKKIKKEKDPDAPPPPDLESDVLNEITAHLEACGGSCVLGKLSTKFPGLKKAQLEGHFEVEHGEKDSIVRILGYTGDMDAMGPGPAKKRKKERQKGCFNCGDFTHMSKDCALPRKEKASKADAPPPPDLDHAKVEAITDYLNTAGGSAPLGKVTTVFPGVKKAQLENNFVLSGGGASADPIVSLS